MNGVEQVHLQFDICQVNFVMECKKHYLEELYETLTIPRTRQPATLYQLAFQKWRFVILRAGSLPRLLQVVRSAPFKLLKEMDLTISFRVLRIGFENKIFPLNDRGKPCVTDFFNCVCRFVLKSDRESRTKLHEHFPLLVGKEYCPFENEPPLVRMVLETLFRRFFAIPVNVSLPLKYPMGSIKAVSGWESFVQDPAVM